MLIYSPRLISFPNILHIYTLLHIDPWSLKNVYKIDTIKQNYTRIITTCSLEPLFNNHYYYCYNNVYRDKSKELGNISSNFALNFNAYKPSVYTPVIYIPYMARPGDFIVDMIDKYNDNPIEYNYTNKIDCKMI